MKVERRKIDLNQKSKIIRLWVTVISIAIILMGLVATGAVKMNQVEENEKDIGVLESEQKEQGKLLIRIDENVKLIKEDITELKNRR